MIRCFISLLKFSVIILIAMLLGQIKVGDKRLGQSLEASLRPIWGGEELTVVTERYIGASVSPKIGKHLEYVKKKLANEDESIVPNMLEGIEYVDQQSLEDILKEK